MDLGEFEAILDFTVKFWASQCYIVRHFKK